MPNMIVDRRGIYGMKSAHYRFLDPLEFQRRFDRGRLVVQFFQGMTTMWSVDQRKIEIMLKQAKSQANVVNWKRKK